MNNITEAILSMIVPLIMILMYIPISLGYIDLTTAFLIYIGLIALHLILWVYCSKYHNK